MMFVDDNDGATLENNNKRQVASFGKMSCASVCVFVSSRYYNELSKAQAKRGHHSYECTSTLNTCGNGKQTNDIAFFLCVLVLCARVYHIYTQYTNTHTQSFGLPFLSYDYSDILALKMCKGDKITVVVCMRSLFLSFSYLSLYTQFISKQ